MDWLYENGIDVSVFDDIYSVTGGADSREAQAFNEWYNRLLENVMND